MAEAQVEGSSWLRSKRSVLANAGHQKRFSIDDIRQRTQGTPRLRHFRTSEFWEGDGLHGNNQISGEAQDVLWKLKSVRCGLPTNRTLLPVAPTGVTYAASDSGASGTIMLQPARALSLSDQRRHADATGNNDPNILRSSRATRSSLKRDAVPESSQHHRKGRECTLVLEAKEKAAANLNFAAASLLSLRTLSAVEGEESGFQFRLATKVEPEVSARRAVGQSTRPAADPIGKRAPSSCQKSPC